LEWPDNGFTYLQFRVAAIFCNAAICGALSDVFWRYQTRIFLVATVHSFDCQRKTMGSLKRSNALFASLPPRSFTLNERLHFIISLKRST
jgi:hypothetical protein